MQPTVLKLARRYRAVNEPLVPVAWHEGNTYGRATDFTDLKHKFIGSGAGGCPVLLSRFLRKRAGLLI
jgi:hypothetical protein